jgi:ribosomal protein S12 methylthiotransferase accessory factor
MRPTAVSAPALHSRQARSPRLADFPCDDGKALALECVSIAPSADEPHFEACAINLGRAAQGFGLDFFSLASALDDGTRRAIGQLVWAGGARPPGRLHVGTAASLDGAAIDLEAIAGYSAGLRARHGAALRWTSGTEFVWIEGRSLGHGTPRWVPAQLALGASPRTLARSLRSEPELRPRVPAGIGIHRDPEGAVVGALLDLVERDAFMVTWLARLPARAVDLDGLEAPALNEIRDRLARSNIDMTASRLPTDAPVPVVVACLASTRPDGPALALGVAARPLVADAVIRAVTRAFVSYRRLTVRLADRRPWPSNADAGRLDGDTRALWWATAAARDGIRWLVAAEPGPLPVNDRESAGGVLDALKGWLADAGEHAIVVDVADAALVERLHHHAVAVVAPGLHPLHVDETRPARWSHRIRRVPEALGLPLPAVLNTLPHPLG